jgi:hypothetical protein
MADEEQKQPSQQPTKEERAPAQPDSTRSIDTAQDGEILKASGARPAPDPTSPAGPTGGPVNKAADPAEFTRHATPIVQDTHSEGEAGTVTSAPAPPAADPSEGEA